MSSLPHFLNWAAAAGAAALVIPSLLILYFLKLRRREMVVPSTILWRKAIQDLQVNSPFQRLRRNLLLLLQLLILLALLLAFSRPVTSYRPPPGARSVILIDRSASMSAHDMNDHPRLEEAKRRAKELVDSMVKDSSAMIVAFDDSAETAQSFTSDQVALKRAIDSIEPTDRHTKLKLAYELADASMAFNPDQLRPNVDPADVYLYSDGRALDANDVSVHGKLHFERVGADDSGNVGIVALSAKRNYERPTQVQVFVRLANFGTQPVETPVQLSVDGEVVEAGGGSKNETAFLLPQRWANDEREKWVKDNGRSPTDSVTFDLDLTSAATITVKQMHRAGDVLAADDVAQVVVPSPRQLAVLLVTDGNVYLQDAMASLNLKAPATMLPPEYEQKQPQSFDVVIYDRYTPKWVPEAGNFVYVGAVPPVTPGPGQKITVAKDGLGNPITISGEEVLDWNRDHPILKDLLLNRIWVQSSLKLQVPLDAQTLVDGLKSPLIVLARDGKRTNIVISFDVIASTWPLELSFPMFWHRAMQFLAVGGDMNVRESYEPGASPVIPRANLQRAGGDLKSLTLKGPTGSRTLKIPDTGDFALPPLNQVGVYTTEPPVPQFERMAVNLLDENESNTFPDTKAPGETKAEVQNVKDQQTRREWWWYLVTFVGLPLLFVEWWVYTRRVHL
jgi:hypothetical protein